jgi:PAS domain-containing protein
MAEADLEEARFLRSLLDAIPSFVFAVDEDVRILEYNTAVDGLLGKGRQDILRRRGGDLLHCIHATETPGGCGQAPFCRNCVIRNGVNEVFRGQSCVRRRMKMELLSEGKTNDLHALITVSPFGHNGRRFALLVIEDISEIAELRSILPMCMRCKRIRNDEQYWVQVELYFKRNWDLSFSPSFCPECAALEMENLARELGKELQE